MYRLLRAKAAPLMVVALAFLIFLLAILVRSIPMMQYITHDTIELLSQGALWAYAWFGWELIGEVGLVVRILGAAFFLAFALSLIRKSTLSSPYLRRSVIFEGIYYVFNLPATVFLFVAAPQITAGYQAGIGAAVSFTAQMLIVTPIFLKFYFKLKNPSAEPLEVKQWAAFAIVSFVFALWFKHFMLAFYVLPFNMGNPVLVVGFLNSTLMVLAACLLLLIAFIPWLKKKNMKFNSKMLSLALFLMGLYAAVFVGVALLAPGYLRAINLIDLWLIAIPILGAGVLKKNSE